MTRSAESRAGGNLEEFASHNGDDAGSEGHEGGRADQRSLALQLLHEGAASGHTYRVGKHGEADGLQ